jgi:hypothetical protein
MHQMNDLLLLLVDTPTNYNNSSVQFLLFQWIIMCMRQIEPSNLMATHFLMHN